MNQSKKSLSLLLAIVFVSSANLHIGGGIAAQRGSSNTTAIVGAMLLDGYERPPIHNSVIIVKGDRIVAVGTQADTDIPEEARIIDGGGMTVLPGLIDLHVHTMFLGHGDYAEWFPIFEGKEEEMMEIAAKQLLMAGVTTAVDLGAPIEIVNVRDRINDGSAIGPRLLVSGPWISRRAWGSYPSYFQHVVTDPEEAAQRTQELVDAGVDVIKTWAGMGEADIRAVADVAHRSGVPVHSHLYTPESMWDAIRGGSDVLQHVGSGGNPDYPEALIEAINVRNIPIVQTIAHRIWVYPATIDFPERLQDPRLKEDLSGALYSEFQRSFSDFERLSYFRTTPRQIRNSKTAARQFIDANVIMGMGTDSGSPLNFHTESAWREISALVDSGMSPAQAISVSTKSGAEIIGRGSDLGTIEVGKIADLIMVTGNPLSNIEMLSKIEHVMKEGVLYK
ncbi:MAG: amidohydrolase family protein [Longimicrobiales bacterium]|jgi:imidazolonepropionase-like amidohydrolase|nr:amidohydrolase family protein [Longimicrobiales bacterium]|tara:strand:- start:1467 stop:2813 length:1347 start_codon:yes stop_codon:yes gene_type:complete